MLVGVFTNMHPLVGLLTNMYLLVKTPTSIFAPCTKKSSSSALVNSVKN